MKGTMETRRNTGPRSRLWPAGQPALRGKRERAADRDANDPLITLDPSVAGEAGAFRFARSRPRGPRVRLAWAGAAEVGGGCRRPPDAQLPDKAPRAGKA